MIGASAAPATTIAGLINKSSQLSNSCKETVMMTTGGFKSSKSFKLTQRALNSKTANNNQQSSVSATVNKNKAHTPGHDTTGYRIPVPINMKITPQTLASTHLGNLLSVR